MPTAGGSGQRVVRSKSNAPSATGRAGSGAEGLTHTRAEARKDGMAPTEKAAGSSNRIQPIRKVKARKSKTIQRSKQTRGGANSAGAAGEDFVVEVQDGQFQMRIAVKNSGATTMRRENARGWAQVLLRLARTHIEPEVVLDRLDPPGGTQDQLLTRTEQQELAAAGSSQATPMRVAEGAASRAAWQIRVLESALDAGAAAELLGVDDSRVRQRLRERTLLGVRGGTGGQWLLPRFQFTDTGEIPHLSEVLRALPHDMALRAVAGFLTSPKPELVVGGAPTDPSDWLLGGGEPELVVNLAAALDRQ